MNVRAVWLKDRRLQLNAEVLHRRIVDFQHIQFDVDLTVGIAADPIDQLPVLER